MAKIRSPRYPAIGLGEAVERARAVYENDFTNEVPKEVVAEHMGYSGLNGASLGVISAVSKYGLLTGGVAGMRITPRALSILANELGDDERANAVREAAQEPALFQELFESFPNGASDQAIRSHLITKRGFLPKAVPSVIRAFRDTETFLKAETPELTESDGESGGEVISTTPTDDTVSPDIQRGQETSATSELTGARARRAPDAISLAAQTGPELHFAGNELRLGGIIRNLAEAERVIDLITAIKGFLPSPAPEGDSHAEASPSDPYSEEEVR